MRPVFGVYGTTGVEEQRLKSNWMTVGWHVACSRMGRCDISFFGCVKSWLKTITE